MKFKSIKIGVLCILSFSCLSVFGDLPNELSVYLSSHKESIIANFPSGFSEQQIDNILVKLKDYLEQNFEKEIQATKNYQSKELVEQLIKLKPEILKKKSPIATQTIQHLMWSSPIYSLITRYFGGTVGNKFFIKYQGYPLTFTIKDDKEKITLELEGYEIRSTSCLTLFVTPQEKTVYIAKLYPYDALCPIPSTKQGTFLLNLSEDMARAMAMEKIALIDHSFIQCKKNLPFVDFKILRLLTTGKGWYESHGYEPSNESARSYYLKDVTSFLAYKLKDIFLELSTPEIAANIDKDLANTAKNLMQKYLQTNEDATFAKFMSDLYQEDCALYTELASLFFDDDRSEKLFTIENLVPIGGRLEKAL